MSRNTTPANTGLSQDLWKRVAEWYAAGDTGISSETIARVLLGLTKAEGSLFGPNPPSDAGDFGRCYRLLVKIPEFKSRLGEVAQKYPEWEPVVQQWDRLTALFERDRDTGGSLELSRVLQGLHDTEFPASRSTRVFRLTSLEGDALAGDSLFSVPASTRRAIALRAGAPSSNSSGGYCVLAVPARLRHCLSPNCLSDGVSVLPRQVPIKVRGSQNQGPEPHTLVVGPLPFRLRLGDLEVRIDSRYEATLAPIVPCAVIDASASAAVSAPAAARKARNRP